MPARETQCPSELLRPSRWYIPFEPEICRDNISPDAFEKVFDIIGEFAFVINLQFF
jgi:hypothetical protein